MEIVTDQIRQIGNCRPKYSSRTILMAFMLYSQSPSCYTLIRNFLILPHKRYLQSLSSSVHISADSDINNKNYLVNVVRRLPYLEKVVILLIDEIYITARLDYRSGNIVGSAVNKNTDVAKTVLTYMISSPFGNLKEVVKLLSVRNITGPELIDLTKQVINFIQECGLEILCVVTDNHATNRTMFKMLSDNFEIPNPKDTNKKIFLLYDFVHIFKNIWKNWLNLKNLDQTFVFYDWDNLKTLRYAKFQDIRNIYHSEENSLAKQAFKLTYNSLYPSIFERQKVILADNIFHSSTRAALINKSIVDTTEFIEIIRKWWDIVNNRCFIKGICKRNEYSTPFKREDFHLDLDEKLKFLKKFISWLDKWHTLQNYNGKLCNETYQALRQSTVVLIALIKYCFETYPDVK